MFARRLAIQARAERENRTTKGSAWWWNDDVDEMRRYVELCTGRKSKMQSCTGDDATRGTIADPDEKRKATGGGWKKGRRGTTRLFGEKQKSTVDIDTENDVEVGWRAGDGSDAHARGRGV